MLRKVLIAVVKFMAKSKIFSLQSKIKLGPFAVYSYKFVEHSGKLAVTYWHAVLLFYDLSNITGH